jgi:hypothetical protein
VPSDSRGVIEVDCFSDDLTSGRVSCACQGIHLSKVKIAESKRESGVSVHCLTNSVTDVWLGLAQLFEKTPEISGTVELYINHDQVESGVAMSVGNRCPGREICIALSAA